MSEEPLFRASYMEVFLEYEALPVEKRAEYRSLHGWRGVNDHPILAIFKTNRYATNNSTNSTMSTLEPPYLPSQ